MTQDLNRHMRPSRGKTLPWQLPEIRRITLPNGLRVWHIQRTGLPIATLSLVLKSGSIRDSREKAGTASLTAAALDAGTSWKDAMTISQTFEQMGTSFRARATHDGAAASITSLVRNLPQSLRLYAEVICEASFPAHEVERLRRERLAALQQAKDRPALIAGLALERLLYGERHPYGTDPEGSEPSLRALRREDLVDFHHRYYRPGNGLLISIAPLPANEAQGMLSEAFANWKGAETPGEAPAEIPPRRSGKLTLIDRAGAPQSEIRIGRPSLRRNSPQFFAAIVMNRMLGGQFTSRLNASLREARGYTYGAWSQFGFGALGGPFLAGAAVQSRSTADALGEFIRVLEEVRQSGLSEEELRASIEGIAGGFALAFETPRLVAGVLQNLFLYNLPDDYYSGYLSALRSVRSQEILALARVELDTSTMESVVVGDAKQILPELEALGPVTLTTPEALGL